MNRSTLAIALASTLTLGSAAAFADEAKHFRHGHGQGFVNHVRPVVVPAPVVRHVVPAPVYVKPVRNHGRDYGHNGYWRNGKWIAPVLIGAAVLGTVAAANHYNTAPAVTYVQPQPTYIAPVVTTPHYTTHANDAFSLADRNRDGVVDKWEAGYDREWDRWFYDIDTNRDGVLTRHEIANWNLYRQQPQIR
jgi:EF hand